ncbi:hypothetical protein EJ06DRAFT_412062 [Trichodelitschia bisporula]|uniref:Uncharacterized protein n=1 Tax=Trichodelitschia bisporula TaxID=703511 RepID=A0A6G1HXX5_9PEZI|nr:hypothetical protein EJ06DRAFT_412062 [Trichodelitschia bisporula]
MSRVACRTAHSVAVGGCVLGFLVSQCHPRLRCLQVTASSKTSHSLQTNPLLSCIVLITQPPGPYTSANSLLLHHNNPLPYPIPHTSPYPTGCFNLLLHPPRSTSSTRPLPIPLISARHGRHSAQT